MSLRFKKNERKESANMKKHIKTTKLLRNHVMPTTLNSIASKEINK